MANGGENPSAHDKLPIKESRVLIDPYRDWSEGEGIPIHLDFGHNLLELETGPCHVVPSRGRGVGWRIHGLDE